MTNDAVPTKKVARYALLKEAQKIRGSATVLRRLYHMTGRSSRHRVSINSLKGDLALHDRFFDFGQLDPVFFRLGNSGIVGIANSSTIHGDEFVWLTDEGVEVAEYLVWFDQQNLAVSYSII